MATLLGVNATLRDGAVPAMIPKGEQYGRVRVAYDTYTSTGAIAINDLISMMILPAGARVIDVYLSSTDHGTVGLCTVGWAATSADTVDLAGFLSTVDIKAAAITTAMSTKVNLAGMLKKFTVATQVQIKITEATDAAGTFKLAVTYVID